MGRDLLKIIATFIFNPMNLLKNIEQGRQRTIQLSNRFVTKIRTDKCNESILLELSMPTYANSYILGVGSVHIQILRYSYRLLWVISDVLFLYLTKKFIFQCYAAVMPIIIMLLRAFSSGSSRLICRCSEQLLTSCSNGCFLECSPSTVEAQV
jgi:hypothetical protein